MKPVDPIPSMAKYALAFLILISFNPVATGQVVVASSLLAEEPAPQDRVWLQYMNYFEFKSGMSIDSDISQRLSLGHPQKRFSVRSIFRYKIVENLRLGAGMAFFWTFDSPSPNQELRFMQEVSHFKQFRTFDLDQRLLVEERITQYFAQPDDFKTRLRYKLQATFPSRSGFYWGLFDEIFSVIESHVETPLISRNRAGLILGYNTYQFMRFELHVMREDLFRKEKVLAERAWMPRLIIKHIL